MNYKITKISSKFFSFLLLVLSISFKIIKSENSSIYLDFPSSIMLSNGNIFVIHQNGVSIYDSTFSKLISDEVIFNNSEKINHGYYLSKITIEQFENGFIITIINDYIYIFDYKGTFIFKSTEKVDEHAYGYYYSIVPIKFFDGYYYYIIAFIDSGLIYFDYYKFHLENKINDLLNRYELRHEIGTQFYLLYDGGLCCHKMAYSFSEDVLSCFFVSNFDTNQIASNIYSITEEEIINKRQPINININKSGIKVIKSAVNYSGTKSIVCVMLNDGTCYCFKYYSSDIDQGTTIQAKTIFKSIKCNSDCYSLKVRYIKGLEQFVISCIGEDKSIQTKIYSDSLEMLIKETKFANCTSINGYSILYSFTSNEYYDLSDIICNGKRYPFNILTKEVEEEIPTTIISTTLIKTTIPTTLIKTTIPTTLIKTTIPTTLIKTTIPTTLIKTTIPTTLIQTTIPSTLIQTTIPTTIIQTTIIDRLTETDEENEIEESNCIELEKCSKCNTESILMNLCIKCNKQKGFYLLKYGSLSEGDSYIDCVNNDTKPEGFYFNEKNKYYELCYYSCASCEYGGNINENNCTSCETNYIANQKMDNSINCVVKCAYYYYYNIYEKYKCTSSFQCPDEYSLFIQNKKKCIENCSKDDIYKYQYNGECLLNCPENTIQNNNLCKDVNIEACKITEREFFDLDDNLTESEIEFLSKNYAKEFTYTDNHLSIFKNDIYSIGFYKNNECLSNTSFPNINFGNCYKKVQNIYGIHQNLIIVIIDKKINNINRPKKTTYSMIEPISGKLINIKNLCENELISVNEKILSLLQNSNNIDEILHLIKNNVDIFNLSSPFYTDICYEFNSPFEKDIVLKDRLSTIFPNITLCETGCEFKGANISTMEAICECKIKELLNQDFLGSELLMDSPLGEIVDLISQTNINVVKCYKRVFNRKYFSNCIGGIIIMGLLLIQIILVFVYYLKSLISIRKYLFSITNKYLTYLMNLKQNNLSPSENNTNINNNTLIINNNYVKSSESIRIKESNKENNRRKSKKKVNDKYSKKISQITMSPSNYGLKNSNPKKRKDIITETKNLDKVKRKQNTQRFKFSTNSKKGKTNNFIDLSSKNESPVSFQLSDQRNKIEKKFFMNIKDDLNIDFEEYLSTDIEDMEYEEVIKKDKRNFGQYFCDKLKSNQLIINIIFEDEPLRPKTMKLLLFIMNISLFFCINGLFFDEEYISEVFHFEGKENLFSFITRAYDKFIYTTLVGVMINYMIDFFFLDEKKIKAIFRTQKENLFILQYEMGRIARNIKLRFNLFNIISILIIIFIWYYISCFNVIYPSSRIEWIISSILIIIIMQILSMLACLLETIIRFIAFKAKSEKIYKFSLYFS